MLNYNGYYNTDEDEKYHPNDVYKKNMKYEKPKETILDMHPTLTYQGLKLFHLWYFNGNETFNDAMALWSNIFHSSFNETFNDAMALIIYLQLRFGGRCILPGRFREFKAYEKVPVIRVSWLLRNSSMLSAICSWYKFSLDF